MSELIYIQAAQGFIRDALNLIKIGAKESRIRENFTSYLRQMFPPGTKWVDSHIHEGEKAVHIKRNGRMISGFIDNCIDNIVIEYEKNLNVQSVFEEGFRQIREYTAAFVNKGVDEDLVVGILSDTINWYVYKIQESNLSTGNYTQDNINLSLIDELHISDDSVMSAERLMQFLQKNLGKVGGRLLTAEALSKDFGLNSKYTKQYVSNIVDYVNISIIKNREYYSLIENLWCSFVEVESHHNLSNDVDTIQHTYALEFYISIIAKLLAANILVGNALLSDPKELKEIISGEYFENMGIYNFAEYDYFGWLTKHDIASIIPTLQRIQYDLSIYDYSDIKSGDLFGSLLVQLANEQHRLLLGQELTPFWLATKLVKQTVSMLPNKELPKFVDMCCGSGSMLIATINETKKLCSCSSNKEIESAVLSCATGFDIDPLATILAKINWIINVADVIDFSEGIYIPIYHSDSLFLSSLAKPTLEENALIYLYDKKVTLPKYLLNGETQILFDALVNKCHDLIFSDIQKSSLDQYIDEIWDASYEDDKKDIIKDAAFNLYKAMYALNKEGKNGLWSFVLKNSLRPSLIRANFNGIVSNTPWLAMSKIANNPYKESLHNLAKLYNLIPKGASAPHLEMATIFLISAIDRYLAPDGVFGCILPHSVINGKHHVALRIGNFKDAEKPVDAEFDGIWLLNETVFKNKSIALFGKKSPFTYKNQILGGIITQTESTETLFQVKSSGNMTIWTNESANIERIDFNYYKFIQGADIMPRALFFFSNEKCGQNYRISKIDQSSEYSYFLKDMKVASDFIPERINVPSKYFIPVLLSHCLTPFMVKDIPLSLLPIQKDSTGEWTELDENKRKFLPRPLQHLFSSIYNKYAQVKKSSNLFSGGLNMRNKLTSQDLRTDQFIVVYGAGGSRTCAAYFKLNKKIKNLVIDQTIYYYTTHSEAEALYLSGMLNSSAVAEANAAYQAQGMLGKRHLHTLPSTSIPKYDPLNSLHQQMVLITSKVKCLMEEKVSPELLNPNKGSVSFRRSKIYKILDQLDEFHKSNEIAYRILMTKYLD